MKTLLQICMQICAWTSLTKMKMATAMPGVYSKTKEALMSSPLASPWLRPLPIIVCKVAASNFWLDNEKLLWVPL